MSVINAFLQLTLLVLPQLKKKISSEKKIIEPNDHIYVLRVDHVYLIEIFLINFNSEKIKFQKMVF
jgi:hypothetical protein